VAPTGGGTALLDWDYTTDGIGNPTFIDDLLGGVDRDYGYQDVQYFLTQGDGPWGTRDWTYDRIGNRLVETRNGGPADVYGYLPNSGAVGNTAKLTSIQHGSGGTTAFSYDPAGNRIQTNASGVVTDWTYDDASRLSRIESATGDVDLFYDGRSFLSRAEGRGEDISGAAIFCDGFETGDTSGWGSGGGSCVTENATVPVYGSAGVLMARDAAIILTFAGRPVAVVAGGIRYVSVDHLGAPILLTSGTPAVVWDGGFEPFGGDFAGASPAGLSLRYPGQWEDAAWSTYIPDAGYYNLHRWYEGRLGRYTRPDPARLQTLRTYGYALSNPLRYLDPSGLQAEVAPLPGRRDPFVPPFDPSFPSGPWGRRPEPSCCDEAEVDRRIHRIPEIIRQLEDDGTVESTGPSGVVVGGSRWEGGGWFSPIPFSPFSPGCSLDDPCVAFCCRVHEWYHFTDRRWWSMSWDFVTQVVHTERPAYEVERFCLMSFR
jgi:RHS repeat-associated protein